MLHRPTRWDFGLRYLHDDLPPDEAARVERLCFIKEPAEMEARAEEASNIFWNAVDRLSERGLEPLDDEGVDMPPVRP
jgi:hypothetical protein